MLKILETVDWLSTYPDSAVDFESFLSGWFLGTPLSELRRGNVLDFLAWTMYAKATESLSKSERKNVLDLVRYFAVGTHGGGGAFGSARHVSHFPLRANSGTLSQNTGD